MSDRAEALRFVEAMQACFSQELEIPGPATPMTWLAGGTSPSDDPVVLYRLATGGPVVGRRWDLDELRSMFLPSDPESLAEAVWESQVDEPDHAPRRLDVDWADDLADEPRDVLWFGRAPDRRRR